MGTGSPAQTETPIAGAADASYELVAADAGKHVRAKARFEDLLGNGETLASRRIGPVMFTAGSCPAPAAVANGSVELIWTAEVGVANTTGDSYGYSSTSATPGSLSPAPPRFRLGTTDYTVTGLSQGDGELNLFLDKDLPQASAAGLVLHVCDAPFELEGSGGSGGPVATYYAISNNYSWASSGLDWSMLPDPPTRRVWLSRADTTAPMLVGMPAVVGTELTLTYDEALDAASKPTKDAFTLAVTRPGAAAPAIAVTDVALAGGELTLTLSDPVRHGDTATLTYRRATEKPIQDPAGNEAAGFEDLAVTVRTNPNELATGTVEISPDRGPYTVGDILTATVSGVADADGLPGTIAYEYQWIRIDGTLETPIDDMGTGKTKTYTLALADADKKFRARVRFLDLGNNREQLESAARPRTGGVMWNADPACATPTAVAGGTEELIWTAQVDVVDLEGGNFGVRLLPNEAGGLSESMFTLGGHRYQVSSLQVGSGGVLVLEVGVEAADRAGLTLYVCDVALPFADGAPANFTWQWDDTGLDWEPYEGSTRRVWLTRADTTAPMLLPQPDGVVVVGATLTLTFDEALDAGSKPAANAFTLAVTRPGAAASETEDIEVTGGVKVSGVEAVLTLNETVLYGDTVTLTYAAPTMNPLQDPAGNDVAGFARTAHNATPEGPTVERAAFVGGPAPACAIPEKIAYKIGDTIKVEVTFSEAVTVTPASTARPQIALEIDLSGGAEPPQAVYVSGSGSDKLVFAYTVVEGDLDTDGIAVARNGLALPAGGTIVTTAAGETVILRHAREHDALHKVDGVLPVALAATAAGPTVTVTWSERLCEAPVPSDAGGFRVRIGSADGPAVDAVAVSGATAVLTLASAIADGTADVTLEYTPPGTDPIRDAAGNEALAFPRTGADPAVGALPVTVTPDTRAPELAGTPTVDGATLVAIFDEALDPESSPDASGGFTVTVTRGGATVPGHTVSGIVVSERTVTLTLALPVRGRDTVTLDYDPPSTKPLQDSAATPNPVAAFSGRDVDNRTPSVTGVAFAEPAPAPACAIPEKIAYKIDDTIEVDVTFTEAVRVSGQPVVTLDIGGEPRPAVYVSGSGSDTLVFAYTVVEGDPEADGIAIAAGALTEPPGSGIVTEAGGRTVQPGHDAVAADRPVDGVRPRATAAEAAGPRVTVTWSERLCEAPVPSDAGGFRVKIGSADGPAVDAVAVAGATTVLTLADAIADGTQDATLEYTPPSSGAKIRDAAGNDAAAFPRTGADPADALEVTVTPDTRAPELAGTPTVDGATLVATFDEALDPDSSRDASGGFTVTVTRGPGNTVIPGHTVSGIAVLERTVTLTLEQAVRGGDTVTLDYDPAGVTDPLRDRATTPNAVAAFSGRDVDNRTPSVTGVAFAEPAPERPYKIDDTIEVEVRFTEAVRVTTTSTARPQIALEIDLSGGGQPPQAVYVSGSGSDKLVFAYTVVEGDEDEDGIAIAEDALTTPTGSAIVTEAGRRTVQRGHDAVAADGDRLVDGVRPVAIAAAAEGLTVTVTWSEAIDPDSARSDSGGFTVKIGTADGPDVTAVAVDGTDAAQLRLTLASAIADGTTDATLEYLPPSTGAKIRDLAGNDALAFPRTGADPADALPVSVTPDTTAPAVSGAAVNGATLVATFDEPLDETSVPAAPGGFTVTVTRGGAEVPGHTVSGIAVAGATATLTLALGVLPGDTVTLAYGTPTLPSPPLRDRAVTPNDLAAFSNRPVDNRTDGLEVTLSKTEADERGDPQVTLTVTVVGGGTAGAARAIAIAPASSPSAAETEDWTLAARALALRAGGRQVSAALTVVDDARLEDAETVAFAVTADGAAIGQVTLTIADNDKARLVVDAPARVVEGETIALALRLDPDPLTAPAEPVAPDACIVDAPVIATLAIEGDTGALAPNVVLDTVHSFEACARAVAVSVPTKAPDDVYMAARSLGFALARTGADERIGAAEPAAVAVTDSLAVPLVSATVNGDALTLTFGETLDPDSKPAPGDFTATADGAAVTVTGVALAGDTVTLSLARPAVHDEAWLVSYTPGAQPLQGPDAKPVAEIAGVAAANDDAGPGGAAAARGDGGREGADDPVQRGAGPGLGAGAGGFHGDGGRHGGAGDSERRDGGGEHGGAEPGGGGPVRGAGDAWLHAGDGPAQGRGGHRGGAVRGGRGQHQRGRDGAAVAVGDGGRDAGDADLRRAAGCGLGAGDPGVRGRGRGAAEGFGAGGEERQGERGTTVVLTLADPVAPGQAVLVSYSLHLAKPLRDPAGNRVASFSNAPAAHAPAGAPRVEKVRVISTPALSSAGPGGTPDIYGPGETIRFRVAFSAPVTVTETETGAPAFAFELANPGAQSSPRLAAYDAAQSSATVLVFAYTVLPADRDSDGIAWARDALAPGPAGIAAQTAGRTAAVVRHAARGPLPGHRVDGSRSDTAAPALAGATVDGTELTLRYEEALDAGSVPAPGDFTVRIPTVSQTGETLTLLPDVDAVTVDGDEAVLTLRQPVRFGETAVTLEYRPGAHPLRDAAGNDAEGFERLEVVNLTKDTEAPRLDPPLTVNGDRLTLTWNEPLDKNSVPAPEDFTVLRSVSGEAVPVRVDAVTVSGRTAVLTLEEAVRHVSQVKAGYTPPQGASPLQDRAGNAAPGFAPRRVDNLTPDPAAPAGPGTAEPVTVNGTVLTLVFDERLDEGSVPAPGDFTVRVPHLTASGERLTLLPDVDLVAVVGHAVVLTLGQPVRFGETATLDYTPGANPLRVRGGDPVPGFAGRAVKNMTKDTEAPRLDPPLTVTGDRLTLSWNEPLDPESVPDREDFTVGHSVSGTLVPVTVLEVRMFETPMHSRHTVVLVLAEKVLPVWQPKAGYTPDAARPLQDLAGNAAPGFEPRRVTHVAPGTGVPVLARPPTVTGNELMLTWSEPLDHESVPVSGDFSVARLVDGTPVEVSGVTMRKGGSTVVLTLRLTAGGRGGRPQVAAEGELHAGREPGARPGGQRRIGVRVVRGGAGRDADRRPVGDGAAGGDGAGIGPG